MPSLFWTKRFTAILWIIKSRVQLNSFLYAGDKMVDHSLTFINWHIISFKKIASFNSAFLSKKPPQSLPFKYPHRWTSRGQRFGLLALHGQSVLWLSENWLSLLDSFPFSLQSWYCYNFLQKFCPLDIFAWREFSKVLLKNFSKYYIF